MTIKIRTIKIEKILKGVNLKSNYIFKKQIKLL